MRALRPKTFKQRVAIEAKRNDGLTNEQHKAMLVEFDRRIASFMEKWRGCRDGRCRRHRQCLGPSFVCTSNGGAPRWTKQQYRRLRRDIVRNPPRRQHD